MARPGLSVKVGDSNFTLLQGFYGFSISLHLSDSSHRHCPGILGFLPGLCFFGLGFLPNSFKLLLPTSLPVSLPTLYYWRVCSLKKTSFWCVLDNEETLLECVVEISPLSVILAFCSCKVLTYSSASGPLCPPITRLGTGGQFLFL